MPGKHVRIVDIWKYLRTHCWRLRKMGVKAEIRRLRQRATLKVDKQPQYAAGYLKALDDMDEFYTDITRNYRR
jgi:hypothetical protein